MDEMCGEIMLPRRNGICTGIPRLHGEIAWMNPLECRSSSPSPKAAFHRASGCQQLADAYLIEMFISGCSSLARISNNRPGVDADLS
jgi:hypothetical protein